MSATSHRTRWDDRIARARHLAAIRPAARELLNFYAAVAEYQQSLAARSSGPVDLDHLVREVPALLEWLGRAAPPELAASVGDLTTLDPAEFHRLVASGFNRTDVAVGIHEPVSPAALFVVELLLQAFAEQLVTATPALVATAMHCPQCGAPPVVAVLREAGHGAKRSLMCARCLTEWGAMRMVCPACGEQEFDKLPIYTAEQFPHVRIDACDRCHHYIKTIDLTKDGLAVPCVDDIVSVSLDLWAREQGYTRLKKNVLGI